MNIRTASWGTVIGVLTPYEVVTMLMAGLLIVLVGFLLVRCSRRKKDD
jgi:predicted CDP-diglyceride synthetase/phosphatidate cytidylyltransferase